ncbi:hypothetical protein [Orrella dioscoreae]|uniref:hypothetical protein n=1 Tax=Orrella dioscoreae TaxID=1851544 RepID=UPI000835AA6C|nr:hypothetical protein [Orrella dioscoreae]
MNDSVLYAVLLYLTAYGFIVVWALLSWLACACLSAYVASTKGHSAFWWFLWGLVFGPLGLIAAAGLGPVVQRVRVVGAPGADPLPTAPAAAPRRQEPVLGGPG